MEAVNIICYFLIFCIGCLFGSFSTLAVYRLPLHQDITHKHSYCPNCNHKLSFLDLIPVLSYIFLGGKCRYCKTKIRIRYLILEVLTGITFLLVAVSLKLNIISFNVNELLYIVFIFLYIAGIVIIAGIDKEKRQINKPVLLYEFILLNIYMIYLYVVENANIYRYVIYLFVVIGFLFLDNMVLKRKLKSNYTINILILSIIMSGFTFELCFIYTVILTLISIAITLILKKIIDRKDKNVKRIINMPIGFYLCVSNIICLIIINFMANGWFK